MALCRFESRLAREKFGAGCEEIYRTEVVAAGLTFFASVAELWFQQSKKVFLRRSESEAQRIAASLLSTIVNGCLQESRSDQQCWVIALEIVPPSDFSRTSTIPLCHSPLMERERRDMPFDKWRDRFFKGWACLTLVVSMISIQPAIKQRLLKATTYV